MQHLAIHLQWKIRFRTYSPLRFDRLPIRLPRPSVFRSKKSFAQNGMVTVRCNDRRAADQGGTTMSKIRVSQEQKRQRHIQQMKERLERLNGKPVPFFVASSCTPEMEEAFLEHILAFEESNQQPLFDHLVKGGVQLPEPDALDDAQLHRKLWEVIQAMALMGHYLSSTDHLSDRQLYELLWTRELREPTTVIPSNPDFACHIDILGGCSTEDLQLRLKYYADEEDRLDWARQFPEDTIPPHETPPYDRDRHLPGPPTGDTRTRYPF
jgi:hypothetical protein